jgi:DNA-directed RNA polymerase specialized sigma24 family protein
MKTTTNRHSNKTHGRSTHENSCRVFEKDLGSLYQLAFLLTGDREMAESILVEGIEECVDGNPGFGKWARSWARRIIISSAIRLIAPLPWGSNDRYLETDELRVRFSGDGPGQAIARLLAFDRFVFVMSVLERIPDPECAELLGCGTLAIVKARIRALQTMVRAEIPRPEVEARQLALVAPAVA